MITEEPPTATATEPVDVTTISTRRAVGRVFLACVLAELLLVVCDYAFNFFDVFEARPVRRIWNIAREQSVPTWFSSTQAVCVGLAAVLVGVVQRRSGLRGFWTLGWFAVGCWFVYLGIDDACEIHEKIGSFLGDLAEENPESKPAIVRLLMSLPSYNWQSFIAPVYGVLLIASIAFAWRDLKPHGLWKYLVGGFALYVASQGLDFLEGHDRADEFYESLRNRLGVELYTVTHAFKALEEFLEMLGTTLFLVGFLHYLAIVADGLTLRLDRGE